MAKQILHLVFGGELTSLDKVEFKDLNKTHFVGLFPNFAKARDAWRASAQSTVDNAHMRYFVVHLHRLLQPDILHESKRVKRKQTGRGDQKATRRTGKARNARTQK
jgi:hypothetical protein